MASELSTAEASRLERCESVIERGIKTFVEVGTALMEIRDSGLYRRDYSTFDSYCRERWGIERTYAHRMIEASQVVGNLLPIGNIPETESQARPLASLGPVQQREAWSYAVESAPNGKPTAAEVKAAVNQLFPSKANGVLPGQMTFVPEGQDDHIVDPEDDPAPPPGFDSWMKFYNDQLTFFTSIDRRGGMGVMASRWSEGQRVRMASALEYFVERATDYIEQVKGIDS